MLLVRITLRCVSFSEGVPLAKFILIILLSVGGLFCHLISSYTVRRVKSLYALFPLNVLMFFLFFSLYFFAVSAIEASIYGSSGLYDVEALIFLLFAIVFSVVSSAFHVRSIKREKKLDQLV